MKPLLIAACTAIGAVTATAAAGETIDLRPHDWSAVAEVDERYQSYNVEMVEVIGGRFWKPYARLDGSARPDAEPDAAVALDANLFEARPPADFESRRLRVLAAALGPAYIRVSGSWANTVYFQDDDNPPAAVPDGFRGVLTRNQWRGVVEFARAVDGELVISFAINDAVRDSAGVWTPVQAAPFLAFSQAVGGDISAASLFNEPNLSRHAGGPPDYDGAAFARDIQAFRTFVADSAPGMRVIGPGDSPGLVPAEEYLSSEPRPVFDVFDYHFYGAVSQRCSPPDGIMGITPERALSEDWLALTDRAYDIHAVQRDRYAPGAPIWITETAGAACGGAPWSATFLDTFRYLDQMGRLAKRGADAIFHNTLAASEYGLIDDATLEPRPNYWAALLWRRLMGTTVLDAGDASSGLHLYAHCLRGQPGDVAVLAINLAETASSFTAPHSIDLYSLSSDDLQSTDVQLNGRALAMRRGDRLPSLRPQRVRPGRTVVMQAKTIAFFGIRGVGHPGCMSPPA